MRRCWPSAACSPDRQARPAPLRLCESHLRADRSYKLWRALLYGRLEDEKPFNTVKRLVQQEDYALALMQRAGLPSPEPYGVAELTPEREYLIVFAFIDGAREIGEVEVDDAVIDQGLAIVRKLWGPLQRQPRRRRGRHRRERIMHQIEELWLQAQSVPSASRIPCVQAFPTGIVGALAVRDGASVLELSHASVAININAGDQPQASAEAGAVTVRLTTSCAIPTTGVGQTIALGVQRFQLEGPAGTPGVVDRFPGGCVTYRPEPDAGASAALLDQARRAVTYRTREDLREASDAALAAGSSLTPKAATDTTAGQGRRRPWPTQRSASP